MILTLVSIRQCELAVFVSLCYIRLFVLLCSVLLLLASSWSTSNLLTLMKASTVFVFLLVQVMFVCVGKWSSKKS